MEILLALILIIAALFVGYTAGHWVGFGRGEQDAAMRDAEMRERQQQQQAQEWVERRMGR